VPGPDPFTELHLDKLPLGIEGAGHRLHFIDISQDKPAEAEEVGALGQDHRAIDGRKAGDEISQIENGLIEERNLLSLAVDIILPADDLPGSIGICQKFRAGVHNTQHQGAEPLARFIITELVLDVEVAVFGHEVRTHLRREIEQHPAVAGIADYADNAPHHLLGDYFAELRV